jgi:L-seryl-tRNA(Ser) seleniumtransferase
VDKMTLSALEATLRERLLGQPSPVASMLSWTPEELRRRAAFLMVRLAESRIECSLLDAESAVGGGSLPGVGLPTTLLAIEGRASRLMAALRLGNPPVLARVEGDRCCIDLRTVLGGEDDALHDAIQAAALTSPPT